MWYNKFRGRRMFEAENKLICPKCGKNSGDDWTQCVGGCPMKPSPYYNEEVAKQYGDKKLLTEVLPNDRATINEEA